MCLSHIGVFHFEDNTMQQRVPDKINHRLIKTFTCKKLSERAKGKLQYQLWQKNEDSSLGLAISHNESTGGFSSELILIESILSKVKDLQQLTKPFHATVLKDLFFGRSANNHCFLAAILVNQKVLRTHTQVSRLLEVDSDFELWTLTLEDHLKNMVQSATTEEYQVQDITKQKIPNKKNAKQTLASVTQGSDIGGHDAVHQTEV